MKKLILLLLLVASRAYAQIAASPSPGVPVSAEQTPMVVYVFVLIFYAIIALLIYRGYAMNRLTPEQEQEIRESIPLAINGRAWTTAAVQQLLSEIDALRAAFKEFDNDDNWLIESEYIDRKVKSRSADWVFIGKWDPRVFAIHAIKGDFLELTKPEERRSLSEFYDPNPVITDLCKERDQLKAENEKLKQGLMLIHENELEDQG